MINKIFAEQPFQVLSSSFSISPSSQNYVLQVSSNGIDYSDLFSVSAGQTKMCTSMAAGSFYRLKNNASQVTVNWVKDCGGGSGSGPQGAQGPQGPAGGGEGGDSHVLLSSSAAPATLNEGDVWAFYGIEVGPAPADKPFSSVTKTHIEGERITFYLYVSEMGGKQDYQFSVDEWGNPDGPWGFDWSEMILSGPYGAEKGIKVDINGSEFTFTTLMPEDGYSAWMCDFNPPVVEPQEGWHAYQVISGESKEIALKEDLPEASRLLPESANDTEMLVWGSGEWRLSNRAAVVFDGLVDTGNYTDQLGKHQTLNRSSQWGMEWRPTVAKSLHAVSRQYSTIEADDNLQEAGILTSRPDSQGNVNLYYSTNETVWDTANRRWRPSDQNYGVNTYSHARYLITTGGQFGFVDDDDTNNTVMQIACYNGAIEGIENLTLEYDSEGGYYSGQTPAGNTLLAKDFGQNTFYVCIGTDPATMQYEGTLTPVSLSDGALYVKGIPVNNEEIVPTSPSIARIWKGNQAEYDALVSQSAVSDTTLYIIL